MFIFSPTPLGLLSGVVYMASLTLCMMSLFSFFLVEVWILVAMVHVVASRGMVLYVDGVVHLDLGLA